MVKKVEGMNRAPLNTAEEYTQISYQIGLEASGEALQNYADDGTVSVAALGPVGSNSHVAVAELSKNLNGTKVLVDLRDSFEEVLDASVVAKTVGLLPIVNKVGGRVSHGASQNLLNAEAIRQRGGKILAAFGLPIEHCLLAARDIEPTELEGREVLSHPQALAQCDQRIGELGLQAVAATSTSAAAASLLGRSPEDGVVAIAPRLAAEVYGLKVIEADIGDAPLAENVTMMAVVTV